MTEKKQYKRVTYTAIDISPIGYVTFPVCQIFDCDTQKRIMVCNPN
jgi:hypothetical protein